MSINWPAWHLLPDCFAVWVFSLHLLMVVLKCFFIDSTLLPEGGFREVFVCPADNIKIIIHILLNSENLPSNIEPSWRFLPNALSFNGPARAADFFMHFWSIFSCQFIVTKNAPFYVSHTPDPPGIPLGGAGCHIRHLNNNMLIMIQSVWLANTHS